MYKENLKKKFEIMKQSIIIQSKTIKLDNTFVKSDLIYKINELLSKAVQQNAKKVHLYYTGDACNISGDWLVLNHTEEDILPYQENISLQEILDIAEETEYKEDFIIVSDCNFSGNWTYKANQIFPMKKYKFRL